MTYYWLSGNLYVGGPIDSPEYYVIRCRKVSQRKVVWEKPVKIGVEGIVKRGQKNDNNEQ